MLAQEDRLLLGQMAAEGSLTVSRNDWEILGRPAANLSDEEKSRLSELNAGMMRGLLKLLLRGHEFVAVERIHFRFGNTVRGLYPEANETFLTFAQSYLTLLL
jgi:hypothetical protein